MAEGDGTKVREALSGECGTVEWDEGVSLWEDAVGWGGVGGSEDSVANGLPLAAHLQHQGRQAGRHGGPEVLIITPALSASLAGARHSPDHLSGAVVGV